MIELPLTLLITSILGAMLAGFVCSTMGVFVVRMGTALILGPLAEKARLESNVVIGFLFSIMIALAFIFLNFVPGQAASGAALRILWGSIFSVGYSDLMYLFLLSFVLILFITLFYKELLAVMFHRKLAESSGVNTKLFYFTVLFFTGFAVSLSLQLVGGLLVFALIVNPFSMILKR